jgi:adenylate kinase family enzyme
MERSMITIGGRRGSGRSTLAKHITEQLQQGYDVQYISFGDTVRAIGRQSIDSFYSSTVQDHLNGLGTNTPLDDEIAFGIMSEALTRTDEADLVVVDGHPKNKPQAENLIDLAAADERTLAGLIITTTDEETALHRLLKRGRRGLNTYLDESDALERIHQHDQSFGEAVLYLYSKGIRFQRIDTTESKTESAQRGLIIAKSFLGISEPTNPIAP